MHACMWQGGRFWVAGSEDYFGTSRRPLGKGEAIGIDDATDEPFDVLIQETIHEEG